MLKTLPLVIALLLGIALPLAAQTDITIILIGDTHSHLDPTGPRDRRLRASIGGYARLATVLARAREKWPNVIAVGSGDALQGDIASNFSFGVLEFQLLKQMGFDAMAVGNHELGEYGPDGLAYALNGAYGPADTLPLLSANVDLSAKPELAAWIKASTIKDVGGVKVGIFGMTVPNTPLTPPDPVVVLGASDPQVILQIAGEQAAALRAAGAGVVLMLSHLGLAYDEAVAANVPGIDVILGGHDHLLFTEPKAVPNAGGQTLIVHPGIHTRQVVQMRLTCGAGAPALAAYEVIPLDASVPEDPVVKEAVEGLKAGIRNVYGDMYDTAVAEARRDIPMTFVAAYPTRDTPMGNLITDALRARTNTEIAITAIGLISEGLYKGPLVNADVFRCVAYGYDPATGLGLNIVTLEITGAELIKALEATLSYLDVSIDYFLQVSGFRFSYDPRLPVGSRVLLETVSVNGEPLDPARAYTATVNEYVAALIPMMGVTVANVQTLDDIEYYALRDYAAQHQIVGVRSEGRIIDASVPADEDDDSCAASAAGWIGFGWIPPSLAALLLPFACGRKRSRF